MQRSHCPYQRPESIQPPARRIEVTTVDTPFGGAYAVLECDDADSMRWLRSAHPTPHQAAYAAAQYAVRAELPLWFPHVDGEPNPLLQALEDVLFAEGVIAYCTGAPDTLWHATQKLGYNAAAARYPELRMKN